MKNRMQKQLKRVIKEVTEMNNKANDISEQVISNYQKDEGMMIIIYAQWCVNNKLDPQAVYLKAYPDQSKNEYVMHMLEQTVSIDEAEHIPHDTVLQVLSLFGNEDLAFVVSNEINAMKETKKNE
jgi:type III secretory pathway component EscR